jgi:phosphonate transport system substrate-binding protein
LKNRLSILGFCILAASVLVAAATDRPTAEQPGSQPGLHRVLRFGMSRSLFREFNAEDGLAATKVWLETLVRDRGILDDNRVFLFETPRDIEDSAGRGEFDIALMTTPEFLALAETATVREWFTYRRGGARGQRLALITRKDSGITSVGGLAGSEVIMFASEHTNLARLWLGIKTLETGRRDADAFFGSIEIAATKASQAILPVFFGQTTACVVTEEAFEVTAELNPQIGDQLHSIARSEPVAPVVLAAHTGSDQDMLRDVYQAFATAHQDPAARQVFTMYRLERLEPIDTGTLDSVRDIIRQHRELKAATFEAGHP